MTNDSPDVKSEIVMQKPRVIFDFNMGTLIPLVLLAIAGWNRYAALETKVEIVDQRGTARIAIADKFYDETRDKLSGLADIPLRVSSLEEQNKAINARLDRLADVILSGQDAMRKDLQAAIEPLRKDIAAVGTKVEVLGDRIGIRPQAGIYRPR